jgi:hypothetical protein
MAVSSSSKKNLCNIIKHNEASTDFVDLLAADCWSLQELDGRRKGGRKKGEGRDGGGGGGSREEREGGSTDFVDLVAADC